MTFDRLARLIDRLCVGLALTGAMGLLVATVITCVSILLKLGRRATDTIFGATTAPDALEWVTPILGEEELVQFAVGAALFAALPYVMLRKGHIRIDLLQPFFGDRLNSALDLVSDLLMMIIAYLILTRQWFLIFQPARRDDPTFTRLLLNGNGADALARLRDSPESQIIGIKLWPTYVVAEFCVAVFLVVAAFCVLRSARALIGITDAR